jgi:hypothetical protein
MLNKVRESSKDAAAMGNAFDTDRDETARTSRASAVPDSSDAFSL